MAHQNPSDQELRQRLADAPTIAMVGASSNPEGVARHHDIDIVDVFRRAEDADDRRRRGDDRAKVLWLQTGIVSEEAVAREGRQSEGRDGRPEGTCASRSACGGADPKSAKMISGYGLSDTVLLRFAWSSTTQS
jgi:hypothetical protein